MNKLRIADCGLRIAQVWRFALLLLLFLSAFANPQSAIAEPRVFDHLSQMLDVRITTPTNGQALVWNASLSRWVNGSGVLAATLNPQAAHTVLAGPASGADAAPTMRELVSGDIPDLSLVYVSKNNAITGAAKTKITYDSKGLVTAGADATTADVADSADKRYVTDAQRTVIIATSGTNTGDQTSVTGNAGTATALATGRTISITGDLAYTSTNFDGTANVTAAGTLATVASAGTTGSSTAIPVITIDAKGRTTTISTAAVIAPAGTLSGSTLASGVTASSLLSAAGGTFGTAAFTAASTYAVISGGNAFTGGSQSITLSSLQTFTLNTASLSLIYAAPGALTPAFLLYDHSNSPSVDVYGRNLAGSGWQLKGSAFGTLATQSGTFSGTSSGANTGDQTITLTGDVTGSGTGSFATAIGSAKVTNAMLAGSIAASKLVGTDIATVGTLTAGTASTGFTIQLSNVTLTGTVPTARLGSGTANSGSFLRGDSTWTAVTVPTIASTSSVLKGDGAGNAVAASANTDYALPSEQAGTDANATWTTGKTVFREGAALTANRTGTLPPASSYAPGTILVYQDAQTTGAFGRAFSRAGSDTLNGGTSAVTFFTGKGTARLETDGTSAWQQLDRAITTSGTIAATGAITSSGTIVGGAMVTGAYSAGNGSLRALSNGGAQYRVLINYGDVGTTSMVSTAQVGWTGSSTDGYGSGIDTAFGRTAAGRLQVNTGTANAFRDLDLRTLIVNQQASAPAAITDAAQFYVLDTAGSGEMFVKDEAGNATQISPHAADSPAYETDPTLDDDSSAALPVVLRHSNDYLGTEEWIHLSALAKEVEKLSGKKFVYSRKLAQAAKWEDVQLAQKTEVDAKIADWEVRKQAAVKARSDFSKLAPEEQLKRGGVGSQPPDFTDAKPKDYIHNPIPIRIQKRLSVAPAVLTK